MADAASRESEQVNDLPRAGVSRWAMVALGTSMAFFCPLLTLLGPLLAVRALVEIRANPLKTGRGMAIAALWLGALGCVGWIVLMFWWNANVRAALIHGPQAALQVGMAGDLAAFRAEFTGDAATADDVRINMFIRELRERYGQFQFAAQDAKAANPNQASGRDVVIPYELNFDRGPVKCDAGILLFARGLKPKLTSIVVKDPMRGEVRFP